MCVCVCVCVCVFKKQPTLETSIDTKMTYSTRLCGILLIFLASLASLAMRVIDALEGLKERTTQATTLKGGDSESD